MIQAMMKNSIGAGASSSSAPQPQEHPQQHQGHPSEADQQLSSWVQRINEAQSKQMSPGTRAELLEKCEMSRQRERSKRKAMAVKSHSVRTHALCADGLRQMARAGGRVEEVVAAQKRWSAAQVASEAHMVSKAARWESKGNATGARAPREGEDALVEKASDSEAEEEEERLAMAEVAGICETEGGAAALNDTTNRSGQVFKELLEQLRKEPKTDAETAAKFTMYETYAEQVEKMRGNLFGIHEENKATLPPMVDQDMAKRLKAIDNEEAMGILDETREWFVFHMMRTAEKNNRHMEKVLDEFEKKLEFLATNEQTECPVCLEAFDGASRAPEVLSCGHRCCKECWGNWVKCCHGRPFCPLCKNEEFVAEIFSRAGRA